MVEELVIKKVACKRCGFEWFPMRGKLPAVCPRCKSYYWNEEKKEKVNTSIAIKEKANTYPLRCLRCGYEWTSPKEVPKTCPRCRSRCWNEEKVVYPEKTCLQCGYKWMSRYEHSPVCPACQSKDWDEKPYPQPPSDEYGNIAYVLGDKPDNEAEPSEPTQPLEESNEKQIMKSIEKRLGTNAAKGDHPAITEKEEHWVEVKSSVVLGVEGKRETRIVNKDEMRKLTGK